MIKDLEKIRDTVGTIIHNDKAVARFKEAIRVIDRYHSNNFSSRSKVYLKNILGVKSTFKAYCGMSDDIRQHRRVQNDIRKLVDKILRENKKIFIVHGRNVMMKTSVEAFLGKLGLRSVAFEDKSNAGFTVIDKFLSNSEDCRYAIVLFSADDIGALKHPKPELKERARQNVVLELGYFMGKIGRENIFMLHEEGTSIEMPSDFAGIMYASLDNAGAWKTKLIKEMREVGIYIDPQFADHL